MDGPTIQAASERALERGATPASILRDVAAADVDIPLVVMTYFNLRVPHGRRAVRGRAGEAGISGVILPDVPLEELGEWEPAADAAGLETVMLASPITPDDRLALLSSGPAASSTA